MSNKISPIMKAALDILHTLEDKIISGDCSEDELVKSMVKFHPASDDEYFNPKDYLNYDEACKLLGIGNNRGKLNRLCKEYGIENVSVKNRPLGFRRKDILKIKELIGKSA